MAMEHYRDRERDRDRDRERDRSRDRDRDRDRDRYGVGGNNHPDFHHQPRRPSLFSDGPPSVDERRSPGNYRGGGGGRRAFESSPRHSPASVGSGFPPVGGPPPLGGFRPMGGGGFGSDLHAPPPPLPLSGQKRGFPFSGRGGSPEHYDGRSDAPSKNFVKLFVGSVPRTATEEDVRPLFEGQGKVLEVALIKDKRTGQQQGIMMLMGASVSSVSSELIFATFSGMLNLVATFLLSLLCQTRRGKTCRPKLSVSTSSEIGGLIPALVLMAAALGALPNKHVICNGSVFYITVASCMSGCLAV